LKSGEVELRVEELERLTEAETPPFVVEDGTTAL